ncbi:hypothetical protein ACR77J_04680 [Tissierella praeacuta]|uniref:hypothetical protein n=1 Tax=Tissierella praeacuta TaxID=43131 RepID=UPI003DA6741B
MQLDKDTYTREEVESLLQDLNSENDTLKLTLEERELSITDLQGQITDYEELKKNNLETNVKMELTKAGLNEDYFDLVLSNDLESSLEKINKLVEINKINIVDNSFRPQEHKANNEYEQAEKKGNTQEMVKSKLSKLFN